MVGLYTAGLGLNKDWTEVVEALTAINKDKFVKSVTKCESYSSYSNLCAWKHPLSDEIPYPV